MEELFDDDDAGSTKVVAALMAMEEESDIEVDDDDEEGIDEEPPRPKRRQHQHIGVSMGMGTRMQDDDSSEEPSTKRPKKSASVSTLPSMAFTFRDLVEADLPAVLDIHNWEIAHSTSFAENHPKTMDTMRKWFAATGSMTRIVATTPDGT
ncbi:hypothetical protein HDU96_007648, partial [Phlyctochytrium bullatum]